MSNRPRILDAFCCAGGAAKGYHEAGFEVFGIDLDPHVTRHYPYERMHGDAMIWLRDPDWLKRAGFVAIHASPPCQGYSDLRHAPGTRGAPRLIGAVREALIATGLPYVIENVEGARSEMVDPELLCGSMFELGAYGHQLQRHRLFETNWGLKAPAECHHVVPVIGVYGGHARCRSANCLLCVGGGRGTKDTWPKGHRVAMGQAMGIDWMTCEEMSEALPPVYTKWIGERLMEKLNG